MPLQMTFDPPLRGRDLIAAAGVMVCMRLTRTSRHLSKAMETGPLPPPPHSTLSWPQLLYPLLARLGPFPLIPTRTTPLQLSEVLPSSLARRASSNLSVSRLHAASLV